MKQLKSSLGLRLIIIGALTLILLIPSVLIQEVISDRETRRNSVASDISEKWGQEQVITGPVLSIPYRHQLSAGESIETVKRYAHFLPETLHVDGQVETERRYRGIYEAILYNGKLSLSGSFSAIPASALGISPSDFIFDEAFVSVGISDMTGIRESVTIQWNEKAHVAGPGIESANVLTSGISISPEIESGIDYSFAFDLNLNGSSSLRFTPVGEETSISLRSDWQDPSFTGSFLPVSREVSADGFEASWNVLHLNRNFPQQWRGTAGDITDASFGVELLLPVDEYQKTMRTAKYAIMFIGLTFLTFFMIELLSKSSIHPVQYLLIGFALLVFYTLLLSLSEYTVFGLAYLISASAIVGLITIYSARILPDKRNAAIVFGILTLLYSYLYVLMQLQDYALLMGSIGLFMVLALVMYLTRHIDWFNITGEEKPSAAAGSGQVQQPT